MEIVAEHDALDEAYDTLYILYRGQLRKCGGRHHPQLVVGMLREDGYIAPERFVYFLLIHILYLFPFLLFSLLPFKEFSLDLVDAFQKVFCGLYDVI